jgi:hypothetical protein
MPKAHPLQWVGFFPRKPLAPLRSVDVHRHHSSPECDPRERFPGVYSFGEPASTPFDFSQS